MEAFVIGIAGGSGSGKSTFAKRLKERFPNEIAVVSCDNYYLRRDNMPFEERKLQNYDSPEAFEFDLMLRQITDLKTAGTSFAPCTTSPCITEAMRCWRSRRSR